MKRSERGFTLIELLLVVAITALIGSAAAMATSQIFNVTKSSNDHMTAIRQAQSAGYWISQDALTSEHIIVDDDPGTPEFLIFTWAEWSYDEDEDSIYHTATYSFQGLSDGIGKLKRTHWSSAGANEQSVVAEYIYYDPSDPDNTTWANYETPILTVQIAASFGEASEIKEYRVQRRPTFGE